MEPLATVVNALVTIKDAFVAIAGPLAASAGTLEIRNALEIKRSLEIEHTLEMESALEVRQLSSDNPIYPLYGNTLLVIHPVRRKCEEKSVFAAILAWSVFAIA